MTKTSAKARPKKSNKTKASRKRLSTRKPSKLTKKYRLIRLLSKDAGADITSISKKFGWLPHTTRATLSRLRKAGHEISSMKAGTGKPTKYHIMGAPEEQSAH